MQLSGSDVTVLVFSSAAAPASPPSVDAAAHSSQYGSSCPTNIDGYSLWHYLRGGQQSDAEVRVPRGVVIVRLCSGNEPSLGKLISVGYRLEESICPNACRDATGVQRGTCDANTQACLCSSQWRGPSCGIFSGCEVGDKAPTVTGSGRGVIEHRPDDDAAVSFATGTVSCAVRLVPDGSRHNGRRGALGVGLMLGATASLSSYNCDTHYIRVLAGDHNGEEIRRFCRSDVEQLVGQGVPWLAADPNSTKPIENGLYIEFTGDKMDLIDLLYASVSLTCPGTANGAGFVPEKAICGGRGRCVDVAYDEQLAMGLLDSAKACVCDFPFASSTTGRSCDTCAFARDPATFPECKGLPPCPNNCSCNGLCTEEGCVCDEGFFGRACNNKLSTDAGANVQQEGELGMRSPFDNGTSGDSTRAGGIDRQIVTCELTSSCLPIRRRRGTAYPGAIPPDQLDATSCALNATLAEGGSRRQNTNVTNSPTVRSAPTATYDLGVQLNKLEIPGWLGDFAIDSNIAGSPGDISDGFTITAWVQATRGTNGFLYAKLDDARTSEGRLPVLDAAVREVRDRHNRPEALDKDSLRVYAAVYLNGAKQQVDVMFSRPEGSSSGSTNVDTNAAVVNGSTAPVAAATASGTEIVVRHFRLGDDASRLFDGEWRYLTLAFDSEKLRGQAYVDGRTNAINPNYVQCFPFLPPTVTPLTEIAKNASQFADRIAQWAPGGVAVVGYNLQGSLDEFRVYAKTLAHVTIVEIGGSSLFGGELAESETTLLAMAIIGFIVCIGALVLRAVTLVRSARKQHKMTQDRSKMATNDELNGTESSSSIEVKSPTKEFGAVDEATAKAAAYADVSAIDIDAWVAERVDMTTSGPLADALSTLQGAAGIVADKKGVSRERFLSTSFLSLGSDDPASPKAVDVVFGSDEFDSEGVDTNNNAASDAEQPSQAASSVNANDVSEFTADEEENPAPASNPLSRDESEDDSEAVPVGWDSAKKPRKSDAAAAVMLPPALSKSQRRPSRPVFPRPDPFDPRTFEVFMSPIVAPKGIAAFRLRQWLRRRYFLDQESNGDDRLSIYQEGLGLVLEQKADAFVAEHHGTSDWQDHKDTEALRKELILYAVMRSCQNDDEFAKFKENLADASTPDAVGQLAEHSRAALDLCVIDTPQDKMENRQLLAVAAATVMLSTPGAVKKQVFRKAFLLGVGNATDALLDDAAAAEVAALATKGPSAPDADADVGAAGGSSSPGSPSSTIVKSIMALAAVVAPRVSVLRDFWQVFALLLSIMTFPESVRTTVGKFASAVALSLDSENGVEYEVNFIICCSLGMVAFLALLVNFVREMRTAVGPKRLERQLREQMVRQAVLISEGKMPGLKISIGERLVQLSIVLLTTMYLPTTRVVLMGLFCHESVLCLYDCYVDPTHKLIVGIGAVVLFCVTLLSPLMLWIVTLRKQREFAAFVGHVEAASDEDTLWAMYSAVDVSPFVQVYGTFRRRWGQFAVVTLVVKALYATIALVTTPDTNGQVVALVLVQLIFTGLSAAVEPFRYRVCNVLLTGVQVTVLLLLSLNSIFRIDPDSLGPVLGQVQLAAVCIVLVVHVPVLILGSDEN